MHLGVPDFCWQSNSSMLFFLILMASCHLIYMLLPIEGCLQYKRYSEDAIPKKAGIFYMWLPVVLPICIGMTSVWYYSVFYVQDAVSFRQPHDCCW